MSETEHSIPLERRPACDSCKTRKTKCDRKSPCASCVTLNVACRITRRAGEKRQRVLLSSKYEDAIQEVNRQLADVKEMLQALVLSKNTRPSAMYSKEILPDAAAYTPQSVIDEHVPTLNSVQESYNGDSSFLSHAHQIKIALGATLASLELESSVTSSPRNGKDQYGKKGTATIAITNNAAFNHILHDNDAGLGDMPLPPSEMVLKLLRLAKTEKQPYFIETPLFEEDEFIALCRNMYFATEPVSLWTWICVNVGLYYLFLGLSNTNCRRLGTTIDALRAQSRILRSNAEAALQSLRLCSEPSLEYCRALAVLANFYVKEGHSTVAWRLISGAARAALDLGLHRLPSDASIDNIPRELGLFWHIYAWDKGLAMTGGRPPTIHHYDVTSGVRLLSKPENRTGVQNTLYGAFLDMAVVMGEIQECLFSAGVQQTSQETRIQHVESLASRLKNIQSAVRLANPDDPTWNDLFRGITTILEIVLHCQLAIVYRTLPPGTLHPHPLQCSSECVDEARMALSSLVRVGEVAILEHPAGWSMLLNTIFSLVPLVPFIVVAGNAIATSSSNDLAFLSKVVSLLKPAAANSPTIRKIHGACESLRQMTSSIISSASPSSFNGQEQVSSHEEALDDLVNATSDYAFPMGQQDWDSVMMGFESELGSFNSRTLANIIEPCFANTYW
ncbi:hypothetical protein F5Y19DRAFT_438132 [Xylariaceae sp. FL1651]|nr:hypothetical protein F5Y19DRAFT_438132 [Xylariaceae sp. FL1651]